MGQSSSPPALLVFSHLRWDFVFQRPQHLMSRFARGRRVYFFEEPELVENTVPRLRIELSTEGVHVVVPHIPSTYTPKQVLAAQKALLDQLVTQELGASYSTWYYTPMALEFSRHLEPSVTIYDCMDELSAFKFAPPELLERERELLRRADLVFTGGQSLFEAKRHRHPRVYAFPSSIDFTHFARARTQQSDPADQAQIPHPRLGFFGVIDERMDLDLLAQVAERRPEWQIVMIGPVVKIDPSILPRASNIHYLGRKDYQQLPAYLAGWDLALLPFARNESTRYISPTKTPEYLAAGRPVVSTSIRDVVRPYGDHRLVHIADTPDAFVAAAELAMAERRCHPQWLKRVDAFLAGMSWDITYQQMAALEYAQLPTVSVASPRLPTGLSAMTGAGLSQ